MQTIFAKIISFVSAAAIAATGAFSSAGNTARDYSAQFFEKKPPREERLNLKIGSACHYFQDGADVGCQRNGIPFGNWEETDLNCRQKFFNFSDLKPGDRGEDTISFYLSGADGCGQIIFKNIRDTGGVCNEPETESADRDCRKKKPGAREGSGELREKLELRMFFDRGRTTGFQGKTDPGEGDNILNEKDELFFDWKNIERCPEVQEIRKLLRQARANSFSECQANDPDGDGRSASKICNGLPRDGRVLQDIVYYFGLEWRLPAETGNEAQTDTLGFDLEFRVKSNSACGVCRNECFKCDEKCVD